MSTNNKRFYKFILIYYLSRKSLCLTILHLGEVQQAIDSAFCCASPRCDWFLFRNRGWREYAQPTATNISSLRDDWIEDTKFVELFTPCHMRAWQGLNSATRNSTFSCGIVFTLPRLWHCVYFAAYGFSQQIRTTEWCNVCSRGFAKPTVWVV